MSRVDNQRRLFLELVEILRPHWRSDPAQPKQLASWLASHRAGSRDRRLYRELAYTLWRILPWVEDAAPEILIARVANHAARHKATAGFINAFADENTSDPAGPASLLPDWLADESPEVMESAETEAILRRAPLWLRQQRGSAEDLSRAFPEAESSKIIPGAWRLPTDATVTSHPAYLGGMCEVQDIGSQALLHCLPTAPTGRWLDACAGAGGKTLQLAQLLNRSADGGDVVAHDVRHQALKELVIRRDRAGLGNISVVRHPDGIFDGVLVDAPCSGSGTWRRAPQLKWTTRPEDLRQHHNRQLRLLAEYSHHVAPGGLLLYATCSICRSENQAVVDAFLSSHAHFRPLPLRDPVDQRELSEGQFALPPSRLDSDGFFLAAFRRS